MEFKISKNKSIFDVLDIPKDLIYFFSNNSLYEHLLYEDFLWKISANNFYNTVDVIYYKDNEIENFTIKVIKKWLNKKLKLSLT